MQMMYAYASSVLTNTKQQNLKKWTLYGKGTKNVLNKYKDGWDLIENEVFPVDPRAIDIYIFFFLVLLRDVLIGQAAIATYSYSEISLRIHLMD